MYGLADVFYDADGDTLRFAASSSDFSTATTAISQDTLTVTAVDLGTAIITVTADDGYRGITSTPFGVDIPTGVAVKDSGDGYPVHYGLAQNYPNPFNPTTTIRYDLPKAVHITLKMYNVMGQEVATLASGNYPAGRYATTWDATGFASGIYVYRMQAGSYTETRKLLLLK